MTELDATEVDNAGSVATEVAVEPAVKIGVVLEPRPDDLGEWLADAAAFEAAGAEALWIRGEPDAELDPLVLAAVLAVVTSRALLLAGPSVTAGRFATLATVGRLGRGRLLVIAADDETRPLTNDTDDTVRFGLARLGPQEVVVERPDPDDSRRWLTVESPEHRAAWRATVADAVGRGYSRVMVPAGPRLLDILRNPDEPDERRDLQLAMG